VNAGERPERAILREVQEELGLTLDETQLQFLQKAKVNHTSKKRTSRFFQYSYAICVPKERLRLVINPRETTQAFLISEKELRKALRVHRIKNMGRISSLYAYWTFLLDSIS
jgi:ADP-ribose pyrophosphatase YjhB (NUDIX family)